MMDLLLKKAQPLGLNPVPTSRPFREEKAFFGAESNFPGHFVLQGLTFDFK